MYQAILSCFYNCNAQATVINFICFPVAIREFALSVFFAVHREGQICWTIELMSFGKSNKSQTIRQNN